MYIYIYIYIYIHIYIIYINIYIYIFQKYVTVEREINKIFRRTKATIQCLEQIQYQIYL